MSVKIQQQLPAVRETSPRPPVEGEEFNNMAQIKMDTLRRTEKSDKCEHSDKCVDGTVSLFPVPLRLLDCKGDSPCSAYFLGDGRQKQDEEIQASTDFSPACTEHGTPSYFKWSQDLHHLLMDIEGVNLFKIYLAQERCETRTLDFWFACEGLKKADPSKTDYIQQVIKLIFKKFVKKTLKEINSETRQAIADKISSKTQVDQTIFDVAQKEVEEVIRKTTYPNFLKSDIYLQHIQLMQNSVPYDSPKTDGLSSISEASSSTNSRDGLDILPTLHEDSELQMESCSRRMSKEARQHNKFLDTSRLRPEAQAGHYLHSSSRSSNSCHVKYAPFLPTSAQDSELQSLSSDAHTDDTLSLTDSSSVDCGPAFSSKNYRKKQQRAAKRNASINKDHLFHNFIPRTQRLPNESTMQLEPDQLAAILIEKLTQVKKEQESQEKMDEYLGKVEGDEKIVLKQSDANDPSCMDRLARLPRQLLTVAMRDKLITNDESDQSILDQHVSRVWSDSNHQTPSRSPGHHSPPFRSHSPYLERRRSAPVSSSGNTHPLPRPDIPGVNVPPCHNTLTPGVSQNVHRTCRNAQYTVPHHNTSNNRHKKERDTYSSDSGTVHDFTPENEPASLPHQSVHIHKHVHHSVNGASVPPNLSRSPAVKGDQYATISADHQGRRSKDATRRSCSKKASTTDSSSSCVDSGVSVKCDPLPLSVSAHERVYNWVVDNGKYSTFTHGPDSEKDSLSRHKKSSHSSTSPVLARSGHAKKPVIYNNSRSGTLEHGTTPWPMSSSANTGSAYFHSPHPWVHVPCGVQPSQPLAQDPSMPILPPPDTTTQLVEASRRLQDEARGKQAKMKASSCGRDRTAYHSDNVKSRMCNKIAEVDENISSYKKSAKKSYPTGLQETSSKPGVSEMTVIGYCFGSDPVPYLTKLPGKNITLRQFKSLLSKKGNYRYFFKKASDEFGTGVVFEEILEDNEVLPLWEGKIFANIGLVD